MKTNPSHLFILSAIALGLISFLFMQETNTVDIHIHDTYFVVGQHQLFWCLALLALLFWAIYRITAKWMYSKAFSWIHIGMTLLSIILLAIQIGGGKGSLSTTRSPGNDYAMMNRAFTIAGTILLWSQLVYVINMVAGLITHIRRA